MIEMQLTEMKKCRAIVQWGPAAPTSGMKAGTYFQVTIDPSAVSPSGEFIRFGLHEGDEIHGWQLVSGMTVCEVLGEYGEDGAYPEANNKPEPLQMMVVK